MGKGHRKGEKKAEIKRSSMATPLPPQQPQQTSKISVFVARMRKIRTIISTRLGNLNTWIAGKLNITRERVLPIERLGGLIALGFTLMQIGEWAFAVGCWFLLGFILISEALGWKGTKEQKGTGIFIRLCLACGALVLCVTLVTITDLRKPEDEPWSNLQKWHWRQHKPPCSVSVVTTSDIIARIHSRSTRLPSGNTGVYKPIFQDLFHDWTINVNPTRDVSQIVISIRDMRKPIDKIRVEPPENAIISGTKPGWISGFEEPSQTPDFYVRTVTFATLDKPTTITIRRPIKSHIGVNTITALDLDLDRQVSASAEKCKVSVTPLTSVHFPLSAANPYFQYLTDQLNVLVKKPVTAGAGASEFTTRLDPDEPYPPLAVNESELIEEIKCNSSPCKSVTIEMEGRSRIN